MLKNKCILLALFMNTFTTYTVQQAPVATIYTPHSVLGTANRPPLYINGKPRFATCTGVHWFHNNYLAAANLHGNKIDVYHFNTTTHKTTLLQELTNADGLSVHFPENLDFNNDGSLLAISNGKIGTVNLYTVDTKTHRINPKPIFILKNGQDRVIHGIRFSPNGKYLVYTTIDKPGFIRVYKLKKNNDKITLKHVQSIQNTLVIKPKSIDFTKDGRFIAVISTENAQAYEQKPGALRSLLAVHDFDQTKGIISSQVLSSVDEKFHLDGPEDIAFAADDSYIIASNQSGNSQSVIQFDKKTGMLGKSSILFKNPEGNLNFPHGISISQDGTYLAVAHYGDDKITVYSL